MLNNEDIKKIVDANKEVFYAKEEIDGKFVKVKEDLVDGMKEVFVTKEDFQSFRDEIREDFSNLISSVDAYAKKSDDYFQEMVMLSHKVDRNEKWIQQIAQKMGVTLEY